MVSGRRHLVSGRCRGKTEQFVGFIRACLVKYRKISYILKYHACTLEKSAEYMNFNENIRTEKTKLKLCVARRRVISFAPPSPPRPPAGPRSRLNLAGKASQGSFLALRIGFSFHKPSLQNEMVARTPVCDWRLCRCVRVCFGSRLLSSRGGEQWTMQWHACPYKAVLTH